MGFGTFHSRVQPETVVPSLVCPLVDCGKQQLANTGATNGLIDDEPTELGMERFLEEWSLQCMRPPDSHPSAIRNDQ